MFLNQKIQLESLGSCHFQFAGWYSLINLHMLYLQKLNYLSILMFGQNLQMKRKQKAE